MSKKVSKENPVCSKATINKLVHAFSEYLDYYDALEIFEDFGLLVKYMPKDKTGGEQKRVQANELIQQVFQQLNENKELEVIGSFGEFGLSRLIEQMLGTIKRSVNSEFAKSDLENLVKKVRSILAYDNVGFKDGHRKYWILAPADTVNIENAFDDLPDDPEVSNGIRLTGVKHLDTVNTADQRIVIKIALKQEGRTVEKYLVRINDSDVFEMKKCPQNDLIYEIAQNDNVDYEESKYKAFNFNRETAIQKRLIKLFGNTRQILSKNNALMFVAEGITIKKVLPQTIKACTS